MKLKRFKERDRKRIGIILFTITCILLVSGVILYRTFAIFEVRTNQNVIKGTVQDPGNLYFAFYYDGGIQRDMPVQDNGYVLDEENSYCGVNGSHDDNIKVTLTEDYVIQVHGVTTSRTKCNLYFVKGRFIQGKGIPIVEEGDGLYEVSHEDYNGEENGWKTTELRFAGKDPKNYIEFNSEIWRIIGLVNVKTNDGIEQRLKIIINNSIGDYSWDTSETNINEGGGINEWSQSDLMKLLNPGYIEETYGGSLYWEGKSGNCYNDQNNVTKACDFLNKGMINSENYIANDIMWNTGALEDTAITANASYLFERSQNVSNACSSGSWCNDKVERKFLWTGTKENPALIGLPYPSDVGYSIGQHASGQCSNSSLLSQFINCFSYSWYPIAQFWTIIPSKNNSTNRNVFAFSALNLASATAKDAKGVMPTLYLKSNVRILNDGQDGSESKPYHLQQIL